MGPHPLQGGSIRLGGALSPGGPRMSTRPVRGSLPQGFPGRTRSGDPHSRPPIGSDRSSLFPCCTASHCPGWWQPAAVVVIRRH